MEKLYRRKTPKVYKNKKLNSANFGTYNLNDYQVFLQLISMIGGVDETGKYLQPQELQREYTLTAKEFSQQFGVELDGAYTTLKRVAKKLTETSITLEKPELFETWHIALCAEAKYNHKQGSLTIEFTPNIMPYLAQVKQKFILYNLKEIANFGSLYSTRLYELIQEFKDTGYIIKSVTQLRETFAVGKKYAAYKDFKLKTFAHAIEEINSQYEMNLRFEELKEGRKVVAIRFEFTPSRTSQGYNPATKQLVNTIVKPKRKISQTTDDSPSPTQQELPNIAKNKSKSIMTKTKEITKKVAGGVLKKVTTPEVHQAIKNGEPILPAAAKARKRRAKTAKDATRKIIEALIRAKNFTEEEATLFAIDNGLI